MHDNEIVDKLKDLLGQTAILETWTEKAYNDNMKRIYVINRTIRKMIEHIESETDKMMNEIEKSEVK